MALKFENGKLMWVYNKRPQPKPTVKALGGFACQKLCGKTLRRPHLTCLTCRVRRVYYGLTPKRLEVNAYILLIAENRRFSKAKNQLLKLCLTVAELLAN